MSSVPAGNTAVLSNAVARLSPSKINAFRDCPQAFAFRYVERLSEPENLFMLRGTLVHTVCERLFDLPPAQRTPVMASALLYHLWEQMVGEEPELTDLFATAEEAGKWLTSAEDLLATWFQLETPSDVPVAERELFVQTTAGELVLAGIIDRLDHLPDGTWSVTDYKTGRAPGPAWERGAFFQLRFYAMVVMQSLHLPVSRLRLVHLAGEGEVLELEFDADGASAVTQQVAVLAAAMQQALVTGAWRANKGWRCDWCSFKQRCPAWSISDEMIKTDDVRAPAGRRQWQPY